METIKQQAVVRTEPLKVTREAVEGEEQRRIADDLRRLLTGQERASKLARAEAEFGLSYTRRDLRERIRSSAPRRWWRERVVRFYDLVNYTGFIPDAAMLRFARARACGVFSTYEVAEVHYQKFSDSVSRGMVDPWLVGQVDGSDRHIVLAYWD